MMKCDYVQNLLLCCTPADLTPEEYTQVSRHLAGCAACRAELHAIQQLDQAIYQRLEATPVRRTSQTRATLTARRTRSRMRLAWSSAALGRWGRTVALPFTASVALVALLAVIISVLLPGEGVLRFDPFLQRNANLLTSGTVVPTGQDRLWIESVSPPPGSRLQGDVAFEAVVGYRLVSAPEGILSLRVAGVPVEQTRYFAPPAFVNTTQQRAVIQFTLNAERAEALFGNGPVQLEATLRAWSGPNETVLLDSRVFENIQFELAGGE